ncbi:MAG TPA: ubiquitin-conjugating enzyme family protein [Nitrosarchaeum sp.]|nr:ubiquitin-conjugating enzyme family protein [Nitrosarchaeum sp.]
MTARLVRDVKKLTEYLREQNLGEPIFLEDNIRNFVITFRGPPDSLYEESVIELLFEVPITYPEIYPTLKFNGRMYHPSVDKESGQVCLDILTSHKWSMSCTLVSVFKKVIDMLKWPDTDSPVNVQALYDFKNNKELFKNLVSNKK